MGEKFYIGKTKGQLTTKLTELHKCIDQLEHAENECRLAMNETSRSNQALAVLNNLLHIALGDMSLEETLTQFIKEITSLSWLALESKGAIYLVGEDPAVLEMKAHHAFDPHMLKKCANVPFASCLCGRSVLTGEIQFADYVDSRHEFTHESMYPHGHYCVPIISGSKIIIGVITLYVREGHRRNQREDDYLIAVSNTVAGVVELKKAQHHLMEREKELNIKSRDLEEVNIALRVLLKKRDEDKNELEQKVFHNIGTLIKPYLEKMKDTDLDSRQQSYLTLLESNLDDIISPLTRKLTYQFKNLTASEIQVSSLIIDGKRTKDIAVLLNVSGKTIEVHRRNLRRKLGLRHKKTDLRSYLVSIG